MTQNKLVVVVVVVCRFAFSSLRLAVCVWRFATLSISYRHFIDILSIFYQYLIDILSIFIDILSIPYIDTLSIFYR